MRKNNADETRSARTSGKARGVTITATSTLLAAALGIAAGPAGADSATEAAVNYQATSTDKASIVSTDAGSLAVEDGVFKIKAANGTVLAGTELSFRVDDFVFPIAAAVTDRTATLTPLFDLEHAQYKPVALPYEDTAPWKTPYDREQAAWSRMTSTMTMGATVGTVVGGIGGGALGCLLGGIAGATVAAVTIVGLFGPFIPAAAVGCLGGILAIGALGTLAGQLLVTAPVAILSMAQYFTTINQPLPAPAK
ncbi:hypothetical protein OG874_17615 [Nocardia sp. NBC_00565]|uniref:hypothetical protein n=1 Tax=Nocardia sp. NBC_00565 TaxID=2975993 RepID=UPI002E80C02D|nr:hypothetical protein [Nocardia sp. NBC_00565]WUC06816.1 hypothetical protein OG874_17615 [Nocardia sp. NBC_00565]